MTLLNHQNHLYQQNAVVHQHQSSIVLVSLIVVNHMVQMVQLVRLVQRKWE
jgi:hypothetical protein